MKTLTDLINIEEPGIALINEWLNDAVRPIALLPQYNKEVAEEAPAEA